MYRYKHHEDSIKIMTEHYRENKEIKALFLIGSVATGTEREDSDIDGVAVVSQEYHDLKKNTVGLEEVYHGKCTYKGGYFNVHYVTHDDMERIAQSGSEPQRNMFDCARVLFCDEPELSDLAIKIPVFQKEEASKKQFKFYCSMRMYYNYFWCCCKPEGFMRLHVAHGIIYNLYRLLLIENEIIFPSVRKLEDYAIKAPNKPDKIIEKCHNFIKSLSEEDCLNIIKSYEEWTTYDYPKDGNVVMNNFSNPYEWN